MGVRTGRPICPGNAETEQDRPARNAQPSRSKEEKQRLPDLQRRRSGWQHGGRKGALRQLGALARRALRLQRRLPLAPLPLHARDLREHSGRLGQPAWLQSVRQQLRHMRALCAYVSGVSRQARPQHIARHQCIPRCPGPLFRNMSCACVGLAPAAPFLDRRCMSASSYSAGAA